LLVLYFCDLFYFIKSLCYFVEAPNLQLTPRMSQDTSTKLMDAITETLLDEETDFKGILKRLRESLGVHIALKDLIYGHSHTEKSCNELHQYTEAKNFV